MLAADKLFWPRGRLAFGIQTHEVLDLLQLFAALENVIREDDPVGDVPF